MIRSNILIWIFASALITGCASNFPTERTQETRTSDTYTTAFPTKDVSDQLDDIQKSVKRISSTGLYVTYFIEDRLITEQDLQTLDVTEISSRRLTSNESTAGTAVSIFRNNRNLALLTNAHVVDYPDTLISYVEGENVPEDTFIRAVKIKQGQNNIIYDLPNIAQFEIAGTDDREDLALLKVNLNNFPDIKAPPLPLRVGDPDDLRWGSFLYIIGYPEGFPMITRGIVSDPSRNDQDDFLTDALFNPGISGGMIMATRDNFNSFEWVGMTNTASAEVDNRLIPDPSKTGMYQQFDAYYDTVYVGTRTQINYGITQSIPMKRIISFLEENDRALRRMGFRASRYRIP